MGWKDLFKFGGEKQPDPLKDLTLPRIRVGFFVDYDMKTWEVTAFHRYDWGEGDLTYEWQLSTFDEIIYLERQPDDEDDWSVSRKCPIGKISPGLGEQIVENGDPPDQIVFENETYYLDEAGGGLFFKDGDSEDRSEGRHFLKWDFVNDSEDKFISIEQWGEKEFQASTGIPAEEYQFSNILPSEEG